MKRDPLAIKQNGNKEGEGGIKKRREKRDWLREKLSFYFCLLLLYLQHFEEITKKILE